MRKVTRKVLGSFSDGDMNKMASTSTATTDDSVYGRIHMGSAWFQKRVNLRPQHRGVHLVTEEILRQIPEMQKFAIGLCHILSKSIHGPGFMSYLTFR